MVFSHGFSAFDQNECGRSTNYESIQTTRYPPLDLSQSTIRLIHILPDLSSAGLVQCRIFYATKKHQYAYLSRISISPSHAEEKTVIVNGELCTVQRDLFDFLCMARHNGTRKCSDPRSFDLLMPIWIEDLCDRKCPDRLTHGAILRSALIRYEWLEQVDSCDVFGQLCTYPGYPSRIDLPPEGCSTRYSREEPIFDLFTYEPLDLHHSSIRLVQILRELSSEGLLQCRLSHALTSDTYVCLSYV